MKKALLFICSFFSIIAFAQQQTVTYSVSPAIFEETTAITITINGNSINESSWGVTGNALYMWAWAFGLDDATSKGSPDNGSWDVSSEASKFTYNAATDTYTKTITPATYYNTTALGKLGFLIKAKNGTGDKKSQDILVEVGGFQLTLTAPAENSTTVLSSGSNITISASNTGGNAAYVLKANGVILNANANTASFSYTHSGITTNQNYELQVTQGVTVLTKKFTVIINPNVISQAIPSGLEDGINYDATDLTKSTLVLDAPGKDFVYVAGSFNNWQPTSVYAMKKDPTTGKFWLELTGLTSGTNYTYQYWVVDQTPLTNSPTMVKIADPYSTLVLSPYDDAGIPSTTYPNMPVYPSGQNYEVTVLKTGQTAYNWQVNNFAKPEKEKLVVYEVLVRDFDAHRNFQDLINRMDYFKKLKINAIELMPVMEYEGNGSWGYNTSFHMALDKFYGTSDKLKEFIDLCHQNGIAVILDVALNHAFGRNPMVRMWMNDPDGDGFGSPDTEKNPITYQIQIAIDNQFSQIVKTAEGTSNFQSLTVNKGVAYYWRVKATDSKNASSNYSATYSFYTEAEAVANHAPFLPQMVQPKLNSFVNTTTVTLKWTASDVDANDVLVYDVYFGTTATPTTKVASNISTTSWTSSALQAATNYYWKVVVKDNKGGETVGQVWNFKTN